MPLSKDHYLNLKNGVFDSTSRDDLQHLFTNFSNDPNSGKLAVHFHGGLVGEKAGMAIANRLLPVYRSAGSYPVFFVWESGLLEMAKSAQNTPKTPGFETTLEKPRDFPRPVLGDISCFYPAQAQKSFAKLQRFFAVSNICQNGPTHF